MNRERELKYDYTHNIGIYHVNCIFKASVAVSYIFEKCQR